MRKITALAFASLLALAGCGDTLLLQGLYGAGAGAAGAALVGGNVEAGAYAGAGINIFCQNYSDRC